MNKIAVIGTGYVGLVVGACLADMGNKVICVDNDINKIDELNRGVIPIYEAGIDEKVKQNIEAERLFFTADMAKAVKESDIIFIAVGTPPMDDGSAYIQDVLQVGRDIGRFVEGYKTVVIKSTVPVGTGQKVKAAIGNMLAERAVDCSFDVVSNPEFLREGSALQDFIQPDRIILGVESPKAKDIMMQVYQSLYAKGIPFLFTNIETAELTKYAANAFLAMKVTFINEMAQICEKVGADVRLLAKGIGMDKRIAPDFLKPGPGYGGSCFPKDTRAAVMIGKEHGVALSLIEQTIKANEKQKLWAVQKITDAFGSLQGKTIGILGITYKAETDDMRDAPSLVILEKLANAGAKLRIFDPQGEKEGRWRLNGIKDSICFCANEYDAANEADALVVLTEWARFKAIDLKEIRKRMQGRLFFDFRNMFERDAIENEGFVYTGIGI
jgi:UDPglucose 6-dehydrogenase